MTKRAGLNQEIKFQKLKKSIETKVYWDQLIICNLKGSNQKRNQLAITQAILLTHNNLTFQIGSDKKTSISLKLLLKAKIKDWDLIISEILMSHKESSPLLTQG